MNVLTAGWDWLRSPSEHMVTTKDETSIRCGSCCIGICTYIQTRVLVPTPPTQPLSFFSFLAAFASVTFSRCRSPIDIIYSPLHMASPIPQISISPPPPQELLVEPYSPFSAASFLTSSLDDVGFRPRHLTPPPTHTKFNVHLSPLRPSEVAHTGKGLGRERFEALLKASKERNAALGGKKDVDLRKEIALKAHKNKQVERRALFLSKVHAPPSPTAAMTPKTPPDSPSIFHYSLPSPGLISPLERFQSLSNDREVWVERVDFRLTVDKPELRPTAYNTKPKALPSLDQISARLSSHQTHRTPSPGPRPQLQSDIIPPLAARKPAARRLIDVGRLRMPVRERTVSLPKSELRVTTLIAPHTATICPTTVSTTNPRVLESREAKAYNMLSTIKRRTVSMAHELTGSDSEDVDGRRTKWKRHSAPADLMPLHERSGFEHPVLSLPGGF